MKVQIGNKYKVVRNEESSKSYDGYVLLLLLIVQLFLNYIYRTFSETLYLAGLIPILIVGYMFHRKIKKGSVDILILAFLAILIALFVGGIPPIH